MCVLWARCHAQWTSHLLFFWPVFHHVPILIDMMIQLYGFQHPFVQFLKFRLGRKWAKTRREDFPTFHHLFDFDLCLLSEQDFNNRLLMVFADIVNSPTYLQRHIWFICPGCLCFVRPNRHSCVTMCCARLMHLRCYWTNPCTACLAHLNNNYFVYMVYAAWITHRQLFLITPFIRFTTMAIFMVEIRWGHALVLLLSVLHPMHPSSLFNSLQYQRVWFLLLCHDSRSGIIHSVTC